MTYSLGLGHCKSLDTLYFLLCSTYLPPPLVLMQSFLLSWTIDQWTLFQRRAWIMFYEWFLMKTLPPHFLRVFLGIILRCREKEILKWVCYAILLFVQLLRPHLCQTICKPFGGFELLLGCDSVPLHT